MLLTHKVNLPLFIEEKWQIFGSCERHLYIVLGGPRLYGVCMICAVLIRANFKMFLHIIGACAKYLQTFYHVFEAKESEF